MATFTIDPTDPNMVVSETGTVMPRYAINEADIAPTAPGAVSAPTPNLSPAAQALLAKRDQVLPPPRNDGLVKTGSSYSESVQHGVPAAQLDPMLQANTASTEQLATKVEEQGRAKTERAAQGADRDLYLAQGQHATAEADREDSAQRAQIARMNQIAVSSQTDPEIDPDRVVREMSTGKQIGMVLLALMQGAFNNTNGQGGRSNQVLDIIQTRVEQDIASQKEQIASGRIRRGNMIQYFREQGMNEEAATKAAEARSWAMIERMAAASKARDMAPEAQEQADLVAQQMRAQTEQKNNELKLALGTDRKTSQSNTTYERPKPSGPASLDDVYKQGQIRQQQLEEMDANEVARVIGQPDADGNVRPVSAKRANAAVSGAQNLAEKLPRVDVAEQQLRNVLKAAGVPDEAYNSETGTIDWDKVSDLRGVGALDSRPALKAGPFAPAAAAANALELTRTDTQDVVDAASALQESITFMTTGAVASPTQIPTFRAQAGAAVANEKAFKENLARTANQIATQRNSMLSGNEDARRLYEYQRDRGATSTLEPR